MKEGDKVIVHKPEKPDIAWVRGMDKFDGKTGTICKAVGTSFQIAGMMSEYGILYTFDKEWLEKVRR